MHALNLFSLFDAFPVRSGYFVLRFSVWPSWVWLARQIILPYVYNRPLACLTLAPRFLIFTRWVVWHLEYYISLDSHQYLICTPWDSARFCALAVLWVPALILRGIPSIISYLTFSEGATKWSEEIEGYSRATLSWGSVSILSGVSLSLPGSLVHLTAIG